MAYVPYRTATEWQQYYADLEGGASDDQKVRIDILGTLENIYNQGGCNNMTQITGVTNGQAFQNDQLIGKNPNTLKVTYGGMLMNNPASADPQYSYDGATGTITFLFSVTDNIVLLIEYSC